MIKKICLVLLLAAFSVSISVCQRKPHTAELDSIVATERAFAATCLEEGIRASFMKFFADSALAFSPKPYVYKQVVAHRPLPANPLARTLRWEPVAGDISASGDLGYLMGPSTLTDNSPQKAPIHYGFYMSVWKKQEDGKWKVIIDIGTDATEKIMRFFGSGFTPLGREESLPLADSANRIALCNELMGLDSAYSKITAEKDVQSAYKEMLDSNAIAIREGIGPVSGKDTILAGVTINYGLRLLEPMNAGVSQAGDLGYTYGSYKMTPEAVEPSGYYVRMWKKNSQGIWKIVVDKDAPVNGK